MRFATSALAAIASMLALSKPRSANSSMAASMTAWRFSREAGLPGRRGGEGGSMSDTAAIRMGMPHFRGGESLALISAPIGAIIARHHFTRQKKEPSMLIHRQFLALAASLLLAVTPVVQAQDNFPDRPIRLFVTFGPGSGPDTLARTIAPRISEALGQNVVIENRPAANGNVAAQQLLQEKRDGYTLILATDSLMTMNPYLLPKSGFDVFTDLTLVAPVAEASVFVVVNPSLKVNNVQELVSLVRASPGKYTYFAPTGTPHHLLAERFTAANQLNWVRVSYRDPQQALSEMLGSLVPIGFTSFPQVASSVNAGKLKLLGVSTSSRLEPHTSVPALNEIYPGMEEAAWFAVYAASGTPRPVIDKVAQAVAKARASTDVQQRLAQFGMRAVMADAPAFNARVKADNLRRGDLIRQSGIRMD
ncbi:MAG: hypothetical protein C0428_00245 [Polaromonas sp.]|nr:hypothetical protein [Polaromonas sp.]